MSSFKAGESIGSTVTLISKNIGKGRDTKSRVEGFS